MASGFPFVRNALYRNQGDGTFERILSGSPNNDRNSGTQPRWIDIDNDGHLDLFVPGGLGSASFLYRNNGDGTFTKVTNGPLVNAGAAGWSASWGDFDGDGLLDLFVGSTGESLLYRNLGGGEFLRITEGPVVTEARQGVWGDY